MKKSDAWLLGALVAGVVARRWMRDKTIVIVTDDGQEDFLTEEVDRDIAKFEVQSWVKYLINWCFQNVELNTLPVSFVEEYNQLTDDQKELAFFELTTTFWGMITPPTENV